MSGQSALFNEKQRGLVNKPTGEKRTNSDSANTRLTRPYHSLLDYLVFCTINTQTCESVFKPFKIISMSAEQIG